MKKFLITFTIVISILASIFFSTRNTIVFGDALRITTAPQGGTGIGSVTVGDIGNCLKVLSNSPFTYELGACGGGGGGSGGNSKWATTTTDITPNVGQGIIVAASSTFGGNLFARGFFGASSTALFTQGFTAYSSSTLQNFTAVNATTTNATTTILNLFTSTGNITVAGLNATSSIVLTAGGGTGNFTGPAVGPTQVEFVTNLVNTWVLDYASSALPPPFCAFWNVTMPNSYDGGSLQARFLWTATTSSGTINWGIRAGSFVDGTALDTALSATSTVTDTLLTANQLHMSDWSAPFTPTGAVPGNQLVVFHVCRASGDTLATNGRLMEVVLGYKKRQFSD